MFALTGEVPAAAELFAHATTLLGGRDPRDLVRTGSSVELHHNRTGQILCTLQALAAATALSDAMPDRIVVAGYSVGELAAWGVAGALTPTTVLDLAARRAEAMDAVSGSGDGMLFVRGLSRQAVDGLCARHGTAIGIVNPGDAFVLGGARTDLRALAEEARNLHAARVVDLPVEVASHTRRLASASAVFREILRQVPATIPSPCGARLLSGIDGMTVVDAVEGSDKLAAQISHPVQWAECLRGCMEAGAGRFLELGPGAALSEMAVGAYREVPARSLDDFRTLAGARAWLAQEAGSRS